MLLYTLDNKSFNIFKTGSNLLSWEWKNYIILRILYHHTTWYTYSKTKILFVIGDYETYMYPQLLIIINVLIIIIFAATN